MKTESLRSSLIATIALYLLTALHHAYGALIYHTPWRLHVVYHGGLFVLIIAGFYAFYRRNGTKSFFYLYMLTACLFGIFIGMYEGGYNHLLKNILYWGGLDADAIRSLFPAPLYELPNDFIFEFTGIIQFFLGIAQIKLLLQSLGLNMRKHVEAL